MSNEITVSGSLGITKPSALLNRDGDSYTGLQFDMNANIRVKGQMVNTVTTAVAIPLGGVTQPHWAMFGNLTPLGTAVAITGAANNGSGLIRIAAANTLTTGQNVIIKGMTGTTEANGAWTVTAVDSTHFDLQGSTFTNTFVAGGTFQLANDIKIQPGSSATALIRLLGGEVAGPLPLDPTITSYYAVANVVGTILDYLICGL